MSTNFLFPSSNFSPARVDEHFQWQAEVAQETTGLKPALVDLEALESGFGKILRGTQPGDDLVYRGWMLSAETYTRMHDAAQNNNIHLFTSPQEYRRAHHFDGWYDAFQHLTPLSTWIPADSKRLWDTDAISEQLNSDSFIVKDLVKSRKHEWDTACYAASPEQLSPVITEFLRLQGEELVGDVVIRTFEDFDKEAGEVRVWWVDGQVSAITAHPDTPYKSFAPDAGFLNEVGRAVAALDFGFVATDIAIRRDSQCRVVEVGDGGVSDFPTSAHPGSLFALLMA